MKKIKMKTLFTTFGTKTLRIPGGWKANIPYATSFDDKTMLSYGRFFQSQGCSSREATQEVLERMNNVFERAWIRYLGLSIRRWARKYATNWPGKIQRDGTLKGFDPEKLQNTYIPDTNVGRRGKLGANAALVEMANED